MYKHKKTGKIVSDRELNIHVIHKIHVNNFELEFCGEKVRSYSAFIKEIMEEWEDIDE